MTNNNPKVACACSGGPKLIFACSGAADVGHISDLAARKLSAEGAGKMFCLAGIGGRVSGILATTQSAQSILAIDGCALDCARKTLEAGGFQQFAHLKLYDMDMEKGKTPPKDDVVAKAADAGRALLAGESQQAPK